MSPIFGPSMRLRLVGVGLLGATFLAGGIAGAALHATVLAAPEPPPAQERDRNQHRPRRDPYDGLGVTAEQRARIDTVVVHGRAQVDSFWSRYGPVLRAIRDTTRTDIDRILTPEQRAELDRRRSERRERERQQQQQQQQQKQQSKPQPKPQPQPQPQVEQDAAPLDGFEYRSERKAL